VTIGELKDHIHIGFETTVSAQSLTPSQAKIGVGCLLYFRIDNIPLVADINVTTPNPFIDYCTNWSAARATVKAVALVEKCFIGETGRSLHIKAFFPEPTVAQLQGQIAAKPQPLIVAMDFALLNTDQKVGHYPLAFTSNLKQEFELLKNSAGNYFHATGDAPVSAGGQNLVPFSFCVHTPMKVVNARSVRITLGDQNNTKVSYGYGNQPTGTDHNSMELEMYYKNPTEREENYNIQFTDPIDYPPVTVAKRLTHQFRTPVDYASIVALMNGPDKISFEDVEQMKWGMMNELRQNAYRELYDKVFEKINGYQKEGKYPEIFEGTVTSKPNEKDEDNIIIKASRPCIIDAKTGVPWHMVEHVRDTLRFKTVVSSLNQIYPVLEWLCKSPEGPQFSIIKSDTDKLFDPLGWGWRITAFDLRMKNGLIVEWYLPIFFMEMQKKSREDWADKQYKTLLKSHWAWDESEVEQLSTEMYKIKRIVNNMCDAQILDVNGGGHAYFEAYRNKVYEKLNDEEKAACDKLMGVSKAEYDAAFNLSLECMGTNFADAKANWENVQQPKIDQLAMECFAGGYDNVGGGTIPDPDSTARFRKNAIIPTLT